MALVRQVVDTPPFTPSPYGLATTVDWVPTTDDHWMGGITYTGKCAPSQLGTTTFDPSGCLAVTGSGGAPSPASIINTLSVVNRGATSFIVGAEFDCSSVGNTNAEQAARDALGAAEAWQMERAFWTGQAGGQTVVFPHLSANAQVQDAAGTMLQTAAITVTGVSGDLLNPAMGLGLLEGALATAYGGVGVIHIPELALPTFDAWGLIKSRPSSPVMYTANGNKVAVGSGYVATAPDGSTRSANSAWLYATGNVFGYRSQIRVRSTGAQAFDRQTNTIKMFAERTVVLAFECAHFAAQVTLGVPKGT